MIRTFAAAMLMAAPALAEAHLTPAPEGAVARILEPLDGASVSSPVTVVFGLRGMGVAPAGTMADGTGHHHLLLNRPPLGEGEFGAEELVLAIPNDETHRHFGGGQTEIDLDLPPGTHTLQLVMGDHGHVPHDPPVMSEVVTIFVE